jgi:hypothetical protein
MSHKQLVSDIHAVVQQRIGEIDLIMTGQRNTASFYMATSQISGQDRLSALTEWKSALKESLREVKRVAHSAPEVKAYQKFLGSPSSMSYVMVDCLIWPSSGGHSKHEEFDAAVQKLKRLLSCEF